MRRLLVIATLIPICGFGQQNEDIIKKYLEEEVYFGEFQLLKYTNERLTPEEYEFRNNFRKEYMNFLNDFGNANGLQTTFEPEDMTDLSINESYTDIFERFENMNSSELEEFSETAHIEPKRFEATLKNAKRFNKDWQEPNGTFQLSTWYVESEGDSMVLYFYLNEQLEIIEFQEDFL